MVGVGARAVGGRECGRAPLPVPGELVALGGTVDADRVNAARVAVAVAVIVGHATVTRRPDENETFAIPALKEQSFNHRVIILNGGSMPRKKTGKK